MSSSESGEGRIARVEFTGTRSELFGLLFRGYVLMLPTIGIYRFWVTTWKRRFYWHNTVLDGEPLEYTGNALQLLIGFLFALAFFLPIYIGFFYLSTQAPEIALNRLRRHRHGDLVPLRLRHLSGPRFPPVAHALAWHPLRPARQCLGLRAPPFRLVRRHAADHRAYLPMDGEQSLALPLHPFLVRRPAVPLERLMEDHRRSVLHPLFRH